MCLALNIYNITNTIYLEVIFPHVFTSSLDPSHKSHNALHKYPTMHQLVAEISTPVHISVTKWRIVGCTGIYLAHDIDLHMNGASLVCSNFTIHFTLFFWHEISCYNNHTPSTFTKFSPRMDKLLYNLGMDKYFYPILYKACDYLFMVICIYAYIYDIKGNPYS